MLAYGGFFMYTIFIEYRILSHAVSDFLAVHYSQIQRNLRQQAQLKSYRFLKGTDQADIFVETFQVEDLKLYHLWKQQLQDNNPIFPWNAILPYISGGMSKFHMWAFQEPALSEYTGKNSLV